MAFQVEYHFTLPKGYVDEAGELHRQGVMRLATAADEILPLRDPRVQQNPGYLPVILLSRVVSRLGSLPKVDPGVIEKLFAVDLAYLQDFYRRLNTLSLPAYKGVCPHCGQKVEISIDLMDEQEI